jgi:hypothetical protein
MRGALIAVGGAIVLAVVLLAFAIFDTPVLAWAALVATLGYLIVRIIFFAFGSAFGGDDDLDLDL